MTRALLLAALAGLTLPSTSDAQILRRVRERAADAAGRAVDRAADRALGREGASTPGSTPATGPASPGSVSTGSPSPGTSAAGASGARLSTDGLPEVGGATSEARTLAPRALQELLPAAFAGMVRTRVTGERQAALGVETSEAVGSYEARGATARVTVQDLGSASGLAAMGLAWTQMQVNRETEDGFERTTTLGDHPAFVSQRGTGDGASSEMTVAVAGRFVVRAEVTGADARVAQAAVSAVDLARLASLAGPPRTPLTAEALQAWLPATLGGGPRSDAEATRLTLPGLSTTQASAAYATPTGTLRLQAIDYLDAAFLTAIAWMGGVTETRTDTGFERGTRIGDHPAIERETRTATGTEATLQVVVGRRFWVELTGPVDVATLRAAFAGVDLAALADLARR